MLGLNTATTHNSYQATHHQSCPEQNRFESSTVRLHHSGRWSNIILEHAEISISARHAGTTSSQRSTSRLSTSTALRATQQPRIWLSPPGAISPMHYDRSTSLLVQVRGQKRMLFVPPSQLPNLYTYPNTHLLARRSRVNVHTPDLEQFPLFEQVQATEAMLGPGDVVLFGPGWSHYTESVTFSASVTCRFSA